MVVLSSLGRMVSLFGLCFLIIGYVHGSSLMYMVALFCFAALFGGAFFAWLSLQKLSCQRRITNSIVFSGDPLEGHIFFNEAHSRWRMLEIYDQHTNTITGNATRRRMALMTEQGGIMSTLVAGSRQPARLDLRGRRITEVRDVMRFARRGYYHLGPLTVYGHDPFGLCYLARSFPAEHDIIVYPRPLTIPDLVLKGFQGRQNTEIRPVGRAGESADFHGIRPYVQGDDLRRVHWKATAHTGKLAIKEFEYRFTGAVQVILDLQHGVHAGAREYSTLETAITLTASVLNHVISTGNQAGMLSTGAHLVSLAQESGRRQLHRALESLAMAKDDGVIPLAKALASDEAYATRRSTAIVITPTVDKAVIGSLLQLHGRSAQVLLVLLDAHSFHEAEQETRRPRNPLLALAKSSLDLKGFAGLGSSASVATHQAHLELMQSAAAAGIEVFPVNANVPLHQALQGIRMRM